MTMAGKQAASALLIPGVLPWVHLIAKRSKAVSSRSFKRQCRPILRRLCWLVWQRWSTTGSDQPPGKQTSSLSTTPTNPQMLDMVAKYANANGNMATARFVLHPSDATLLMRSFISANGGRLS